MNEMEKIKSYFETENGRIFCGDALHVLAQLPDGSVQMCVTSPPYWGLRDYDLPPMVWDAREGCEHVWGFDVPHRAQTGGTENSTLGAASGGNDMSNEARLRSIERSMHKSSSSKFCQLCGAWFGCLGLEPTPELYIKHVVDIFRELRRVLRKDGTLWLNMGDSYSSGGRGDGVKGFCKQHTNEGSLGFGIKKAPPGYKPKNLMGIPWMLAFALRADGWYLRSDIIWHKPNPMPESATDRPTRAHEYIFLLTKSFKYFYDAEAIKEKGAGNKWGKYSNPKYGEGSQGKMQSVKEMTRDEYIDKYQTINKRTVWKIATQPFKEAHFATFPERLIEPCILAGSSRGACPDCESPWKRVVNRKFIPQQDVSLEKGVKGALDQKPMDKSNQWDGTPRGSIESTTLGWRPGCKCYNTNPFPKYPKQGKDEMDEDYEIKIAPIRKERYRLLEIYKPLKTKPCVILDPFGGSMTTAVVSYKYGRKFIMIELSKIYIDEIGIPRIKKETEQRGWARFR